jgi:hypothetical protein
MFDSAAADCTGAQVRRAVERTATNKGKWNNETGWGMPQAFDAHVYLTAFSCYKLEVDYKVVSKSSNGQARHGSSIKVFATLTSAGKPVAGKVVTIVVKEPWVMFSCKGNSRTTCRGSVTGRTNAQGVLGMSGKVRVKGGSGVSVTVWATTAGTSGEVTSPNVSIPIAP